MGTVELDDVAVFARVVDAGSFSRAARELNQPKSSVSRAVARLEAALSVRLLHRTTRSLSLTDEGDAYYKQVAPALGMLREAEQQLDATQTTVRGTLRVTAPVDAGVLLLGELVAEFLTLHPELHIELTLTGRVVDLVAEGFDLAVRAGKLSDSSLIAKKLGDICEWLVASPDYVKRHGLPKTVKALESHDAVLFRPADGVNRWELTGPSGVTRVTVRGRVGADDMTFVYRVAVAGAGIALLPSFQVQADIDAGRLVRVLPRWQHVGAALWVVTPSKRFVPRKVAAFRDFLSDRIDALRDPRRGGSGVDRRVTAQRAPS